MNSKSIILTLVITVIVGGGAFYGGMKYAEGKSSTSQQGQRLLGGLSQSEFQNLRNLSPEERQQRLKDLGVDTGAFQGRPGAENGFGRALSGEIVSKSEDSLTVKFPDDSSRIVFLNNDTSIAKSVAGTLDDLQEGDQIFVTGDQNPDGSYTAESIQIGNR